MRKYSNRWKKGFAGALAFCVMTVSVPHTVWADNSEIVDAQEEYVNLEYDAGELSRAIKEAVDGGESVDEEWSWNTDSGAALADKYQALFETGDISEVAAEFEGTVPDGADVRVFVKGEKVIFLLTNDSEADRIFRISVGNASTPEITVSGKSEIVDLDDLEKDEIEIKDDQEITEPDDDEEEDPVATGSNAEEGNANQAGGEVNDEDGKKQDGQEQSGLGQDEEAQSGQGQSDLGQSGQSQSDLGQSGQGSQKQDNQSQTSQQQDAEDRNQERLNNSSQKAEEEDSDDQEQKVRDADEKDDQRSETGKEQSDDTEDESQLLSISRNQVPMVTVSQLEAAGAGNEEDEEQELTENAGQLEEEEKQETEEKTESGSKKENTGNEIEDDSNHQGNSGLSGNSDMEELIPSIGDFDDQEDSIVAVPKTVLEGKLYGAFVSDEGSRGRAFVTTRARIDALADGEDTQSKVGTLKLYHILKAGGQFYYETQDIALTEEDFDENGSYYYGSQAYQNRTGLQAVTSDEAMSIQRTQFSETAGLEQQVSIEYQILEGFQIEGQEASPSEADPRAMYFRSAGTPAREGFPPIVPINSTLIEVADHTQYIFTTGEAEAMTDQAGARRYTVGDGAAYTLADAQGSSGIGSSVVVSKDVTNLTLILGSADRDLTLDASGTEYAGLMVEAGAEVTLVLADGRTAVIKGGYDRAGVELEGPAKVQDLTSDGRSGVTIRGEGTLKAYGSRNQSGQSDNGGGAGIGGRGYMPNGELIIESGTIVAVGAGGGAGIGGGGSGTAKVGGDAASGALPYEKMVDYSGGIISISGGHVTASCENGGSGAGIGGGNHGDGGRITIDGNAFVNAQGGSSGGAGIGSGRGSHQWDLFNGVRKNGPGYFHGGEIMIDGDADVTATGGWNSAGIGGGYCDDSGKIVIGGGSVKAYGTGGNDGVTNHGGAGIGGGYEGHGDVLITGGTIEAFAESSGNIYNGAAGIGSGATANAAPERGDSGGDKGTNRGEEAFLTKTSVVIQGGTVEARGGLMGGAGIGAGFGTDTCEIAIEDGDVTAVGGGEYPAIGGAGIGSGCDNEKIKYNCETNIEDISITGGTVTATGAWGASGIGSGAANVRAGQITIEDAADVVAYADGTKFAIDTFDRTKDETEPDRVINHTGARLLQGTFMDVSGQKVESQDYTALQINIYRDLDPTSGEASVVSGKLVRSLSGLPRRYRSFAASVEREGNYLVKAGKTNPDEILFCYDTAEAKETAGNGLSNHTVHYQTTASQVGDHFWLYQAEHVTEDKKPDDGGGTIPKPDDGGNTNPPQDSGNNNNNNSGSNDSGDNDTGSGNTGSTNPGRSSGGAGGSGTVTIEDSPVPLAAMPTDPTPKLYMIDDEDVPLAALPKTGDHGNGPVKFLFLGSLLAGVYLSLSGKRKDEI